MSDRLLLRLAADPQAHFVRRLPAGVQAEARQYLLGLAEHTKSRRSVPFVPPTAPKEGS